VVAPPQITDVILRRLTVQPTAIGPFGEALLSWEVDAPDHVRIKLNAEEVTHQGQRWVRPRSSSRYRIIARAESRATELGAVDLDVDLSACQTFDGFPTHQLVGLLRSGVENDRQVRLREDPTVRIGRNRIEFSLRLTAPMNNRPNPSIDIDGSFGLGVVNGVLEARGERVEADVSVPWYVSAVFGISIALQIALGRQRAQQSGHAAIEGMVAFLRFWLGVSEDQRLHTVWIDPDHDGTPLIRIRQCPEPAGIPTEGIDEVGGVEAGIDG
jgi:hypothetical protein